jgi:hypothetical protein
LQNKKKGKHNSSTPIIGTFHRRTAMASRKEKKKFFGSTKKHEKIFDITHVKIARNAKNLDKNQDPNPNSAKSLDPDPDSAKPRTRSVFRESGSVEYISVPEWVRKFLGIPAPLYLHGSGSFHQQANKLKNPLYFFYVPASYIMYLSDFCRFLLCICGWERRGERGGWRRGGG